MISIIILINFICVYIVDYSGIVFDLSKFIWRMSHKNSVWMGQLIGKPFGCAQCLCFWISLIYLLCVTSFIYALGIACLSAMLVLLTNKLIGFTLRMINKIK